MKHENVTTDTLSEIMDFDHVIRVNADRSIEDVEGIYAPEAFEPDSLSTVLVEGRRTWHLLFAGWSGQDRYTGPWMHDSENFSDGMTEEILSNPGVYVCIYATYPADEDDPDNGETMIEGWTVARLAE